MYAKSRENVATGILLLASLGRAELEKRHVQLVMPTPFVWAEYGPTNPLSTDGSDYPCKIPHGDEFTINGTATEMAIGEEQTVSFSGWSVHGGGSCQFALAEGHSPTPDSAWKVIHSIQGGCPKANIAGNMEPGQNPDTYTFSIPDDFAPGGYTWAWTWVNKIASAGEFYMNCAPIHVAAAPGTTRKVKDRRAPYSRKGATTGYPDLFLANIGLASGGCTTSEAVERQIAIRFPHPGDSVSYPNGEEDLFEQACDGNPRNNGAVAGGAGGQSSSAAVSATEGGGGATMSILPVSTTLVPVPPSATAPSEATSLSSASVTPSPSTTLSTAVSSVTDSAGTATSAAALERPCTDGHLLCVGGTQFSTCTGGAWTAPQGLAAQTTCEEEGEGVGLTIVNHF